jgi:ribosomal protein S18 acetylase RimI-like enzyme
MVTTRTATLNDLAILLSFEQGVIKAERPFDTTLREDPINYYDLSHLITAPDAEVVVAEENGEIIGSGYALIKKAQPFLKHQQFAYLGFMYVKEEYRGQGVNKKVLDTLLGWARKQGLTEIRLEVYAGNEPAQKAYEKAGFQPLLTEMRMGL